MKEIFLPRTLGFLSPKREVIAQDGQYIATSCEPWLKLDIASKRWRGKFVEISYRTSLWDDPVRPIFRFQTSENQWVERMAPGPVAGSGIWRGRIPGNTIEFLISPVNRPGNFNFIIESIRVLSFHSLIKIGWGKARRPTRAAVLTRLGGFILESDLNLAWATEYHPVEHYAAWKAERTRRLDIKGIDAPRINWAKAPSVAILLDATQCGKQHLHNSIQSVLAQVYPNWRLYIIVREALPSIGEDRRISCVTRETADSVFKLFEEQSWVFSLPPGAELSVCALACLIETAAARTDCRLIYADEEIRHPDGTLVPFFKPRWSPILESRRSYIGRAVFITASAIQRWNNKERLEFWKDGVLQKAWLKQVETKNAHSIRRVLLTCNAPKLEQPHSTQTYVEVLRTESKTVSIIIPTRDQPKLLESCLTSILQKTDFGNYEIVIIDNDSVKAKTHKIFEAFRKDLRVKIVGSPGPFNYAALSNLGASGSRADILVFLNNDTQVLSGDWLNLLVAKAVYPSVGTVGAKLLFPTRKIQHVGVVVGMGNSACHFGAGAPESAPGWLGRNEVLHEVTAVTAACLAIERHKFEAVKGFDAEHLAVELNDIDLCLRLAEHGWQSVVEPRACLLHHESASRGKATFRPLSVNAAQRQFFQTRWRAVMRDDPYFHPGLSLYRLEPALS